MRSDDPEIRVLHVSPSGPPITTSDDTSDLIGSAWAEQASVVAIPVARLDPEFFDLSSRVAGEITQKFVNYRLNLAIVGDIRDHVEASDALRDFVWESNRGTQVWFVPDDAALRERLNRVPSIGRSTG
jgi:hypothetical protein